MLQFLKLLFYLLRELIFDNKEEYDYKSLKFNPRKFTVLILVTLSFVANIWMIYRFFRVAVETMEVKQMLEMCISSLPGPPKPPPAGVPAEFNQKPVPPVP